MFSKISFAVLAAALVSISQFAHAKATPPTPVVPSPTACAVGFELAYDVGYGYWSCQPVTSNPQGGGN